MSTDLAPGAYTKEEPRGTGYSVLRRPQPERTHQQLLDRIQQLEEMLGCDDATTRRMVDRFDITGTQARILGMLYRRGQVTREQIYIGLYGGLPDADQPSAKIIDIHLSKVRIRLASEGVEIKNDRGMGSWHLDPIDKHKMKQLLDAYAEELLAKVPEGLPKRAEVEKLITALVSIIQYTESK